MTTIAAAILTTAFTAFLANRLFALQTRDEFEIDEFKKFTDTLGGRK
jgi:hypothetical protein